MLFLFLEQAQDVTACEKRRQGDYEICGATKDECIMQRKEIEK